MKINTRTTAGIVSLEIEEQVTGIHEVQEIQRVISSFNQNNTVELIFKDAYVMPSSLIGYLVTLVNVNNKKVIIDVQSELRNLIVELDLDKIFTIK
jgi:hypothetical protein